MELDKLQVLQGETGSDDHGVTVSGTSVGRGTGKVSSTVTAGGQDGLVRSESVQGTVLEVQGDDTDALSVLHQEVQGKVLDEKVGVVSEGLSVEGVKNGVSGSVGGSGTSVGLTSLAVLEGLTTERSLVNLALFGSGKGDTIVLELRDEYSFAQRRRWHSPR